MRAVRDRYPRIDTLIHNAGYLLPTPYAETDESRWTRTFNTGLPAAHLLTRPFWTDWQQTGAAAIYLSSRAGIEGGAGHAPYVATKHAIEGFVKVLGEEGAAAGILVHAVTPGAYMRTPMSQQNHPPELRPQWIDPILLAPAFLYLAQRADPQTAVMKVKGYSSTVPGMVSKIFIHCKDSYEAMTLEQASTTPVGSGPYKLTEWVKDDHITLVRSDTYTLARAPFEEVVFRVVPEASTRAAELIAGSVDIAVNIPPDQVEAVNATGNATVKSVAGTRRIFVGFNLSGAYDGTPGGDAIKKVEVRKALNLAVDVPTICRQLLSTDCERMSGPANQGNPAIEPYPYDPAKAEEMLDAAGYPRGSDGVRFSLVMQGPSGRYLNDALVEQAVAQYLSDIGVQTTNELMEMSLFSPMAREHRAGPLFLIGQGGATWSAIYDMALFPSRDAPVNNGMWFNEEWQKRWDSLNGIRDSKEERRVVDEMLQIFHEDAPWIFLYFQPDFYGVSNRIDWEPRRDEEIDARTATLK